MVSSYRFNILVKTLVSLALTLSIFSISGRSANATSRGGLNNIFNWASNKISLFAQIEPVVQAPSPLKITINDIPTEILWEIMAMSSYSEFHRNREVCRYWNEAALAHPTCIFAPQAKAAAAQILALLPNINSALDQDALFSIVEKIDPLIHRFTRLPLLLDGILTEPANRAFRAMLANDRAIYSKNKDLKNRYIFMYRMKKKPDLNPLFKAFLKATERAAEQRLEDHMGIPIDIYELFFVST